MSAGAGILAEIQVRHDRRHFAQSSRPLSEPYSVSASRGEDTCSPLGRCRSPIVSPGLASRRARFCPVRLSVSLLCAYQPSLSARRFTVEIILYRLSKKKMGAAHIVTLDRERAALAAPAPSRLDKPGLAERGPHAGIEGRCEEWPQMARHQGEGDAGRLMVGMNRDIAKLRRHQWERVLASFCNFGCVGGTDSFDCTHLDEYTVMPRNGQQGGQRKFPRRRVRIDRHLGPNNLKANAEIMLPQLLRAACAYLVSSLPSRSGPGSNRA